MGFFRREEPLHEKLAREADLDIGKPRLPRPSWDQVGVHGLHQPRVWDVVTVLEPGPSGEDARFVVLPDGTILVEDEAADDADLSVFADAVEQSLEPPYRAEVVQHADGRWAVSARRIRIVELDQEIPGDEIEIAVNEGERDVTVDQGPWIGEFPELERLAEGRHEAFVVRASRLDDTLWEVTVDPL